MHGNSHVINIIEIFNYLNTLYWHDVSFYEFVTEDEISTSIEWINVSEEFEQSSNNFQLIH